MVVDFLFNQMIGGLARSLAGDLPSRALEGADQTDTETATSTDDDKFVPAGEGVSTPVPRAATGASGSRSSSGALEVGFTDEEETETTDSETQSVTDLYKELSSSSKPIAVDKITNSVLRDPRIAAMIKDGKLSPDDVRRGVLDMLEPEKRKIDAGIKDYVDKALAGKDRVKSEKLGQGGEEVLRRAQADNEKFMKRIMIEYARLKLREESQKWKNAKLAGDLAAIRDSIKLASSGN